MDSVAVTVPLRPPTKKMKKRKELDALAPAHAVSRRSSGKRSSQELLSDSSDDRSEYWNISTRTGRKCRGKRSRTCPGFLKACAAFLACVSVLATASLIWLFIDVRQQLTALRTELDQVIAGNEGVPDALQKCHSLSRDLQNNQTIIFSHLSDLKIQINNFTQQVVGIQHGLHQVQEWFQAAPELANVPKDLNALSSSVATFGSQIRDLGATINTLKETNSKVQDIQSTMQQNITNLKDTVLELSNVTQRPQMITTNETKVKTDELNTTILHLSNTLGHVNETLSTNIKWISEDQKKDHTILVSLQERTQDVSAKLMSLQSQCAKVSEQTIIQGFIHNITKEVSELNATNADLSSKLKRLEQSYGILKNSTSTLLAAISDIQNQEQAMKGKSGATGELVKFEQLEANGGVTTEVYRAISETIEVSQKKYTTSKPRRSNKN